MVDQRGLNELALFAGAGGGILGGHLLGWRTVCAVEWEPYPASVLCARQNDKVLPPFPIWDDVQTFDGKPWRGLVDVVSGGFPCQDISAAGGGQASLANAQECGNTWLASLAKFNLGTYSWRTAQCSLLEDLIPSSLTLPKWGLMRNGALYPQQKLAHHTVENEFGLLPNNVNFFHTPNTTGLDGVSNSRKALIKRSQSFPTPRANDAQKRGNFDITNPRNGLPAAVRMWPTPTAHMAKETNSPSEALRNEPSLSSRVGGQLNPMWVEWLMGWPLGWTDLKPLAMDKFQEWQQQHFKFSQIEAAYEV